MTIVEQILDYASMQRQPFRRRDLMQVLGINNVSEASAHVLLTRLVEQGLLVKVGYGMYAFPEKGKQPFVYKPSEEEQTIAKLIRKKFPFADFCIWRPSALVPYMQHIPALGMTFVDVERIAMESVFFFLQGQFPALSILLNPTAQECERYITTEKILIVRALVNEAPITEVAGTPVPTLEKILVDVTGDRELNFAQGSELYTIYENAFSMNNVNKGRLLRYAARRNRKEFVQRIIKTQNL
ncbi:MAG: type IV toxin-antitoxin system AbiEi family antitoxin domain-containing protein [Prevotella sp.]|nr:type IV toxin-antitoxin system AbiEi family antitoxin domain-containing protein [Prevotella sp.]